ncbi:methionine aminopeptidase, type II [Candidatus Methanoperedens nitroreducens]|uniref:Methionine aminopeptidase n=1 Tax=Candidatus Methanoperedens nitratireducens TaxID=1392998 RepID=A0A062V4N5_9EURY|nr:type II methionyl aminopeptidase [Candidatus Methanoperedens nitroreducens]KCZ71563.1 methionine aminopeptidase, type II [Candidatus Methanoperedens nitroreducens]MDJ1421190.1 type II methionyl aminopeptidase [Candidatus Methanoperedens sp.]
MNEAIHGYYIEAGEIAAQVRNESEKIIKEDVPLLEAAEYIENRIEELGGNIAFPCNISINEIASHFTPEDNLRCFHKGDVVKVDIGVHIEGFIADTACTIEIGTRDHDRIIMASEEALEKAITSIRDNAHTRMIGKVIWETIKKYGFNPIKDLTGHSLERYRLHAGVTIPNYGSLFSQRIKKDMVFAIEPFATYGDGNIKHGRSYIFAINEKIKTKAHQEIMDRFGTLPFARRWIPEIKIEDMKGLRKYFELIEASGEIVTQSEHTVIINEDGCEVITR